MNVLKKHTEVAQRASVLIVDDDPVMREMTARLLTAAGWDVTEATDGRVALQRLAEQTPSVIVLDLLMPELDGLTFIMELRNSREVARHSGCGRDRQGRHRRRARPIERVCEDHPPQRRISTKGTAARRARAGQGVLAAGGDDLLEEDRCRRSSWSKTTR